MRYFPSVQSNWLLPLLYSLTGFPQACSRGRRGCAGGGDGRRSRAPSRHNRRLRLTGNLGRPSRARGRQGAAGAPRPSARGGGSEPAAAALGAHGPARRARRARVRAAPGPGGGRGRSEGPRTPDSGPSSFGLRGAGAVVTVRPSLPFQGGARTRMAASSGVAPRSPCSGALGPPRAPRETRQARMLLCGALVFVFVFFF